MLLPEVRWVEREREHAKDRKRKRTERELWRHERFTETNHE
jgi:hypothetical protein